jgi:hypothetical protein
MNDILALITACGVGGILGTYFQSRFQERNRIAQCEHEQKLRRYNCIILLMITKLNPDIGLPKMRAIRPDLNSIQDIDEELRTELLNAFVFAEEHVLKCLAEFIEQPNHNNLALVAVSMRRDLWGKKAAKGKGIVEILVNSTRVFIDQESLYVRNQLNNRR